MTRTTLFHFHWGRGAGVALFLAAGLAAATPSASAQAAAPATPAATPESAVVTSDYVLGPDDVLNVQVWNEPNISDKIPVRPDGKISLPLVGELTAAGRTPAQLQDDITARLRATLTDPAVTVVVEQVNSRKINVIGQVLHPGAYSLTTSMTMLDAIALAGGPVPFAHTNRIYLLRTVGGAPKRFPFDYKRVISGQAPQQDIGLQPGDTIVIP